MDSNDIVRKINNGDLTLMWENWFFSGGHGEDHQRFTIFTKDGELFGHLKAYADEIDILVAAAPDDSIYGIKLVDINKWLTKIIKRDDEKIYALCHDDDGDLQLPAAYNDISREEFLNSLSYSREVNGDTISVTQYDMNDFSIHYSSVDASLRGTAYDVGEDLAKHFGLSYDDIHIFADINFSLDEPLMTTSIQGVAVSSVWMDSSARFKLYTIMKAFKEWEIKGVIDFIIDAAEYIKKHEFQVRVLKNMRIQDLSLVKQSFEAAKNSTARQNIVLLDDGVYLTFKAQLPDSKELQFGELACWVDDEVKEDGTVYDSISNAIGDFYSDTDDVLNERILSGKVNFTKY